MAAFDLKTAVSLLPMMDDNEETTTQLIDAIELYEDMLAEATKPLLVKFVLKSRLSTSAKLRLATTYDDVKSLISDMQKFLLTKKSDTALQMMLNNARQGDKSISEFGKELERLFVDLTISQADGKAESYKILKPLNEKIAVKRFADGLRNAKLSTIISARNYTELKDAVRAAIDEDSTRTINNTSNGQMFMVRSNSRPYRGNFNTRGSRSFGRPFAPRSNNYFRNSQSATYGNSNNRNYNHNNTSRRGQFHNNNNRRGQGRGRSVYRGRNNYNNNNIHFAETAEGSNLNQADESFEDSELKQFFRED